MRMVSAEPLMEILDRRGGITPLRQLLERKEYDRILKGVRTGRLSLATADLAACRIGIHPCRIWPEWWEINHYPGDEKQDVA